MVRDGVLGIALVAPRNLEGTGGDVELGLGFGPVMDRARIGNVCVGTRKGVASERLDEGLLSGFHYFSQMMLEFFHSLEGVLNHSLIVLYQPTIVLVFL